MEKDSKTTVAVERTTFAKLDRVTPCVGVWIETSNSVQTGWPISSHPAWVYMD